MFRHPIRATLRESLGATAADKIPEGITVTIPIPAVVRVVWLINFLRFMVS
jgi:hypothetical protein